MIVSWSRSPIHGLGWCENVSPCSSGRLAALFSRWYSYAHRYVDASVTGVTKLNPFGQAVIGRLFPRENEKLELVPRRVSTYAARSDPSSRGGAGPISTSSIHPANAVPAAGASTVSTTSSIVLPAATPRSTWTSFH